LARSAPDASDAGLAIAAEASIPDSTSVPSRDAPGYDSDASSGDDTDASSSGDERSDACFDGPPLAPPTFTPPSGAICRPTKVEIICAVPDSVFAANVRIYYTLDGTLPTHQSAIYSGPISLGDSTTLTAICSDVIDCYVDSPTSAAVYPFLPCRDGSVPATDAASDGG
jgi:hypothetical protein